MQNQKIQKFMEREVTREEFLKYIAAALLSVVGIATFVKNLHQIVPDRSRPLKRSGGYGNSPYGR